ncbi:MAG: hypothetical protein HKN76_07815 [Saprospiraceae bacterium]|nr:hypothetical protein [Saprospiraceae bacterium]
MNDQETYELIEAYLENNLSDKEVQTFEQRLKSDPDFAVEFQLHKQLHTELGPSDLNDFRNLLKEESGAKKSTVVRRINMRQVLSIAASGAILVAVGLFYLTSRSTSPQVLFNQYVDQPSLSFNPGTERGTDQQNLDVFIAAMEQAEALYQSGDYSGAIGVLESVDTEAYAEHQDAIEFRLGMNYLLAGDSENAISYFDEMSELTESVRWYKSLALLQLGDIEQVIELLSPLASYENPKQQAARQIIKKMN